MDDGSFLLASTSSITMYMMVPACRVCKTMSRFSYFFVCTQVALLMIVAFAMLRLASWLRARSKRQESDGIYLA